MLSASSKLVPFSGEDGPVIRRLVRVSVLA